MLETSKKETVILYCNYNSANEMVQKLKNFILNNVEGVDEECLIIGKEVDHDSGKVLETYYKINGEHVELGNFILESEFCNLHDLKAVDYDKAWDGADSIPTYFNYQLIYEKC